MAAIAFVTGLALATLASTAGAVAGERTGRGCSVEMIAGTWFFATDVGYIRSEQPPVEGDITALGTLAIDRHGNVSGVFDATIDRVAHLPEVTYWGTIAVDDDCTATVEFETSTGAFRRDSLAILSEDEMWGMSQDPDNLWNYTARRSPRGRRPR